MGPCSPPDQAKATPTRPGPGVPETQGLCVPAPGGAAGGGPNTAWAALQGSVRQSCRRVAPRSASRRPAQASTPVDDVLPTQVVQGQRQLADVQPHGVLGELHVLLQVVAQVPAQQQVGHHEHVLLVLEGVPAGGGPGTWTAGAAQHPWGAVCEHVGKHRPPPPPTPPGKQGGC